ncbi:MAG TPA: putative toxin-antitoxin system toxin component, PIN family [Flavobacteriales bacterium]|nr:putative toxin-antitoxin system toxin component, PIN family [Flavobacteriales bacterium]
MPTLRVVVDPNVLVSLLIGTRIKGLDRLFRDKAFTVILDDMLLDELDQVARRSKFRKYFPVKKVDELVYVLELNAEIHAAATSIEAVSRDAADDYLLFLCKRTKADVLLSGDEDLLVLGKHGRTRIMGVRAFMEEYMQ